MFCIDKLINYFDAGLRTINNIGIISDAAIINENENLSLQEKKHSAGLMRVNHVGEVCAQALYRGQQIGARNSTLKQFLYNAEQEEQQHLIWCYQRLQQLNSHTSYLNPLWYIGAFTMGFAASKISDNISLAFIVETEKQVEQHLNTHLEQISNNDIYSKQIIQQMIHDEANHAREAQNLGASELPAPIKLLMKNMAKIMTSIAYYI